jgi:EmrB/QacA subfamily drug resistance transporter
VLLSVGLGTFMTALDSSVVNTLLPVIRREFAAGLDTIQWVVTSYLLVMAGLLLTFGRLGDMRGHRPVYLAGFAVFLLGSVLAGAAPDELFLVAARALQALGGAMILANSPAILTAAFPPSQRGRALGLQATMTYLGLTAGPTVGGWMAEALGWRSVFYVNVPVGIAAAAVARRCLPDDRGGGGRRERFDFPGAALFTAGFTALLLALNQGHAWGWGSVRTLLLLAAAAALLAGFVRTELRSAEPMLDLSLFRIPTLSASTAAAVANYVCLYGVLFLLPLYLIQVRGLSPSRTGLLLSVQSVVMAVTAPLSGVLSDRVGSRAPGTIGMALLGCGLLLLSRLGLDTHAGWTAAALAIVGLGTGIFISPNTSALLGSAPAGRRGIASGVLATARYVGMAVGVALAGAVVTTVVAGRAGGEGLVAAVDAAFLAAVPFAAAGAALSFRYGAPPPAEGSRAARGKGGGGNGGG